MLMWFASMAVPVFSLLEAALVVNGLSRTESVIVDVEMALVSVIN